MALLRPLPALAQESIQDSLIREQESGNRNQAPGATVGGPKYDPCYLAQNAMRPCTPKNAAIAWSPSTSRVGISYRQDSEGQAEHNAVTNCIRNHGGSDCKAVGWVSNGCMAIATSLPEKTAGWSGAGFTSSRAAAWNSALLQCRAHGGKSCSVAMAPCTDDNPQYVNLRYTPPMALPIGTAHTIIDPKIVGTWAFYTNPGRWVWQIGAHGSYSFHSEAADLAPTHAGLITAANGQWTLLATSGFVDSDGGTYRMLGPDTVSMTGKLGTGTWQRVK
jgi:hypothetical protein